METGVEEQRPGGHSYAVLEVGVSADGRRVVSGSGDNTVRIWDMEPGVEEQRLGEQSYEVLGVTVNVAGRRVVTESGDTLV